MSEHSTTAQVQLPPLMAGWMADLLDGPIPDESRATCDNCTMCRPSRGALKAFRPDTKCCSFLPRLANFIVGAVLNDRSPETDIGRSSVEARIDERFGVTPLGLDWPAKYALLYTHADSMFGRSRAMRCPHYIDDGGLCGIWRYRNSICSTYYCQVVRGAVGREFWDRLKNLLSEIESALALWCVEQIHLESQPLAQLLASHASHADVKRETRVTVSDIDGESDPSLYGQAWGDQWIGREREFYIESARLVSALPWSDILAIAGPKVRLNARLAREAYANLISESMPDRLQWGRFGMIQERGDLRVLQALGSTDQLIVLARIVDILPLFDGRRSRSEVKQEAKRAGVGITDWIVQQLIDFKILVSAA
jgi:hypothetical protein